MPEFFGNLEQLVLFTTYRFREGQRWYYTYWPRLYLRTGME